jgi:hypothetical protein
MKPTAVLVLSFACLVAGCVEIDGGAVEISWVIRSKAGSAITDCGCASPSISRVRLALGGIGGAVDDTKPCAANAQCDFPCGRQTGATAFNIPETHGAERYQVSIEALGMDGSPLLQVMAPAPILREVVRGQPTEVASMELVAECATECLMNTSGVCSRP